MLWCQQRRSSLLPSASVLPAVEKESTAIKRGMCSTESGVYDYGLKLSIGDISHASLSHSQQCGTYPGNSVLEH